ncbi:hypothetical protein O3G_MSEX013347, partial [Manduca sexta]
ILNDADCFPLNTKKWNPVTEKKTTDLASGSRFKRHQYFVNDVRNNDLGTNSDIPNSQWIGQLSQIPNNDILRPTFDGSLLVSPPAEDEEVD